MVLKVTPVVPFSTARGRRQTKRRRSHYMSKYNNAIATNDFSSDTTDQLSSFHHSAPILLTCYHLQSSSCIINLYNNKHIICKNCCSDINVERHTPLMTWHLYWRRMNNSKLFALTNLNKLKVGQFVKRSDTVHIQFLTIRYRPTIIYIQVLVNQQAFGDPIVVVSNSR